MSRGAVGRPMEILMVEDDLEDAGMTIEALRSGEVPCRISLVCDGDEALEFLFQRGKFRRAPRPDLVLLDLQLPKVDGREVLTKVRADEGLQRIPVVVLTSSLTHLKILQSENLRVESYLNKPIDLAEFSRVVKSLRKYMLADVLLPQ
jgi:two-component system, chemotaxis family, response regulator Rcp1